MDASWAAVVPMTSTVGAAFVCCGAHDVDKIAETRIVRMENNFARFIYHLRDWK
jgi:hypothetical protein